ncbi:MAG TPA: insulinase family protein, partial [Caldithrix abyssi]|nr:insulinase family protein [Caldithrix abyssi]
MKRRLFFLFTFFLTVLFTLSLSVQAQQVKTVKQGDYTYRTVPGDPLKTRIYKLNNGLTVYLTVYKDAPRLQTAIAVKAGSKYDPHDNTGLAHYLEHMLFKGTDRYGTRDWSREKPEIDKIMDLFEVYRQTRDSLKRAQIYHQIDSISYVASEYAIPNEYDKMLAAIGAKGTNAFTSVEQTVYINDIPANQVEKWLTIEAERFRNPVLRLFHTELEAVYEEKNRGLDSDRRKVYEALLAGLFQKHQYGTQTTIGTIEHLKNPSMKRVLKYFHTYYVPNNMAVCLSGDIDPDQTIRLIDQTLGKLKPSPIPEYNPPKEDPITKPIVKEVYGPDAENVMLAFRFPGANTREADLLTLTDMILMNSQAGLIDLNLNQKQKVIGAGSYASIMKDYSYHALYGRPRQGQTLEEVKDLLLGQLDLIKKGEFPDWLLQAVVNDLKLSRIRQYENNWGRAYNFVKTFTMDVPWQDYVFQLDRLSKFTKQDVIDFANQYYDDNYVVVYKRVGVDKNVKKVKKPPITPVKLNRDDQSDFIKKIMAMPVKDIQP